MEIIPIENIPLIKPGDNLVEIVLESLRMSNISLHNGDIFVFTQKIISKSENRIVNLCEVVPSERARELAIVTEKDPRFIELVLLESNEVLRTRPGTIIVEHRLGFVCANAGIDHSNVEPSYGNSEDWVLLLPQNPDASADRLRIELLNRTGCKFGIMIIDSHGRAWRQGVVGLAIGISGMPGLVDFRGKPDLFGYQLRITQIAVADELAAAASLVMGQAAEGFPIVLVKGFPYPLRNGSLQELIRPKELDLFR